MKIVTKEEFLKRVENKFPNQPIEILKYTRMTQPVTIKCLNCNSVKTYSTASNYLSSNRKGVCSCYNENNKLTKHEKNKSDILSLIEKNNKTFINFGYNNKTKKYTVEVQCNKCNQFYTKTWQSFLNTQSCPFCENKQLMNTDGFKALLPTEYQLLNEYKNQKEKILIKHECGFIQKISPHGFLSHIGCPKCNKRRSSGERKVAKFLDLNYIPYSIEQSFEWQTNKKRRYDFYLPEQNMVIEYMGEQHYRQSSLFKITLAEQQAIDKEKYEDAIKQGINYLAISYKDFSNVDEILMKAIGSTTSPCGVGASAPKE